MIYLRGINLIKSDKNGYYIFNAHGDVVQLTNNSGTITKVYMYDAFGVEKDKDAEDSNPFRYYGEYYDKETGTIYLRARYYEPMTGRFRNEDPIKDGLNWYTYTSNNPVRFVDPSGLKVSTSFSYYSSYYEISYTGRKWDLLQSVSGFIPYLGSGFFVMDSVSNFGGNTKEVDSGDISINEALSYIGVFYDGIELMDKTFGVNLIKEFPKVIKAGKAFSALGIVLSAKETIEFFKDKNYITEQIVVDEFKDALKGTRKSFVIEKYQFAYAAIMLSIMEGGTSYELSWDSNVKNYMIPKEVRDMIVDALKKYDIDHITYETDSKRKVDHFYGKGKQYD